MMKVSKYTTFASLIFGVVMVSFVHMWSTVSKHAEHQPIAHYQADHRWERNLLVYTNRLVNFSSSLRNENRASSNDKEHVVACKLPLLHALNVSVLQDASKDTKPERNCSSLQAVHHLAYVNDSGFLHLNQTTRNLAESVRGQYIMCLYALLMWRYGMDDFFTFRTEYQFLHPDEPVALTEDVADVWCYAMNETSPQGPFQHSVVFHDVFGHPSNASTFQDMFLPTSDDQLSVLVFVIRSTSMLGLQRHLPKTFAYMTDRMGAYAFHGFTKVSEHSWHNTMTALTGKRMRTEQHDMPREIAKQIAHMQYEDWNIIWEDFAGKGYATVLSEDKPATGIFRNIAAEDWKHKPVTHDYSPMWAQLAQVFTNQTSDICLRKFKTLRQFALIKQHLMLYSGLRQFVYASSQNIADQACMQEDKVFAEFFREMHAGGYLNHTAIFLMGDRGAKPTGDSLVHLLEERMPPLMLALPSWFLKIHPNISANLFANQMKLASTFDVHATFKDILEANYEETQRANYSRGLSLLHAIPANRSCAEAGIPTFFCVCQENGAFNFNKTVQEINEEEVDNRSDKVNGTIALNSSTPPVTMNATIAADAHVGDTTEIRISGLSKLREAVEVPPLYQPLGTYWEKWLLNRRPVQKKKFREWV